MELGINGKIALVTAASRGLGFACAQALASEGARVVICARHSRQLNAAVKRLRSLTGADVVGFQADLTEEQSLIDLVKRTEKEIGAIDILVMGTGHLPSGAFSEMSDDDWELGLSLTLRPARTLTKLLVPGMRKRKSGHVIFLSSIFALEPHPSYVVSSTYRAGLSAFAKCLSREAAQDGVVVNVVAPGYFDTPLLEELAAKRAKALGTTSKSVLKEWAKLSPTGRLGSPEELGTLVCLLASAKTAFVQGITIPIDGGFMKGI
jgi:3-oxoacyl-[acyl-carrier protein] reductase